MLALFSEKNPFEVTPQLCVKVLGRKVLLTRQENLKTFSSWSWGFVGPSCVRSSPHPEVFCLALHFAHGQMKTNKFCSEIFFLKDKTRLFLLHYLFYDLEIRQQVADRPCLPTEPWCSHSDSRHPGLSSPCATSGSSQPAATTEWLLAHSADLVRSWDLVTSMQFLFSYLIISLLDVLIYKLIWSKSVTSLIQIPQV